MKAKKHWINAPDLENWLYSKIMDHVDSISALIRRGWSQQYIIDNPGKFIRPGFLIYWNHRMFSTAGRAYGNISPGFIELNSDLFMNDPNPETNMELANTIIHEYCHLLAPGDHHGKCWGEAMSIFGLTATRCHTMEVPKKRKWTRHTVSCSSCKASWDVTPIKIKRWSRYDTSLACPSCRSGRIPLPRVGPIPLTPSN